MSLQDHLESMRDAALLELMKRNTAVRDSYLASARSMTAILEQMEAEAKSRGLM